MARSPPADGSRRNERCEEVYNIQVQALMQRLTSSGISKLVIGVSGGWSPVVHLSAQAGAKALWDDGLACFLPGQPVQAERSAGACAGEFTLAGAMAQGSQAGAEAADRALNRAVRAALVPAIDPSAKSTMPLWLVPGPDPVGRGALQFVDLQNDVTAPARGALAHLLAAR